MDASFWTRVFCSGVVAVLISSPIIRTVEMRTFEKHVAFGAVMALAWYGGMAAVIVGILGFIWSFAR